MWCAWVSSVVRFSGRELSDGGSCFDKEVTVTVLEKLIKEHEKRRKVGKHRYVSDGVRKEYYLKVAFEDGAIETLHVSTATYNKARKGKPKVLTLQKGGFGLPVITKGL